MIEDRAKENPYFVRAGEPNPYFMRIGEQKPGSEWVCHILDYVHFRPERGCEPNAFHRFMQQLCFGVQWRREP